MAETLQLRAPDDLSRLVHVVAGVTALPPGPFSPESPYCGDWTEFERAEHASRLQGISAACRQVEGALCNKEFAVVCLPGGDSASVKVVCHKVRRGRRQRRL